MVIDQALLSKALKFAVVGLSAFLVDFGTVYTFKEKVKLNKYIANTIAFIVSASFNFALNRAWAFGNHDPEIVTQAVKFAVSMTIGFLIATGVIYVFSDRLRMNFYFSKLLGISVAMIWNFTMANLVIFHH
ncbi:MAG: glycosyl transferase family 2 [Bacteroidetes bacterium]|nr:glycosyl transferase family 2 [Bacteroidota bacterium]